MAVSLSVVNLVGKLKLLRDPQPCTLGLRECCCDRSVRPCKTFLYRTSQKITIKLSYSMGKEDTENTTKQTESLTADKSRSSISFRLKSSSFVASGVARKRSPTEVAAEHIRRI